MKKSQMLAVFAIMLFVTVGCASHGTSPKGLEIPIEKAAVKLVADAKGSNFNLIETDDLKKWYDEGRNFTVISTLPVEEDKLYGTLPNAVNGAIPMTEAELTVAFKDNLLNAAGDDKEKSIVVYCGFVACRRSTIGAKILVDNGYKNVYKYPGGIVAWEEKGYLLIK